MFPAVVLAVVRPGAAAGADQGAVQQDDLIWISSARPRPVQRDHHRPPRQAHRASARGRPRRPGRPRLRRPGRRPRRPPRDHHRPQSHPEPQLTDGEKEANRLLSRERAVGEHGFANLKTWCILTKVRMNTRHATTLLRALLVLANTEIQR
ncbi:hypothetical protein OG996_38420 [Streptomyces sp. NBC_00366]